MRTNKPVLLAAAVTMAGHYGVALYIEAKAGHHGTNVPQPPAAAITVMASSTSSLSAITMHMNSITDVEYATPANERQLSLIRRSA
jgi:hypothetical protein